MHKSLLKKSTYILFLEKKLILFFKRKVSLTISATVVLSRMQFDMRIWPYLKSDSLPLPVNGDAKIQGQ